MRESNKKHITFIFYFLTIIITFIFVFSPYNPNTAYADNNEYVYLGGNPIGVIVHSEGVIITDLVEVVTEHGGIMPAKNAGLLKGDMIVEIDHKKTQKPKDISDIVNNNLSQKYFEIKIKRGNQTEEFNIEPQKDIVTNKNKIGITAKNDIAGVGTMTYIRIDNNRFGGLGHQINDVSMNIRNAYVNGEIFDCNIIGYKKGVEGEAGELKGVFSRNSQYIGVIDKNLGCGIFGKITKCDLSSKQKFAIGKKDEVNSGKAYIYTSLKGDVPEKYEIEIIRAMKQSVPNEKGMVIRVTDKRLLNETGGIVQGMSGSPIIQNGKLVGAVTHVFVNDPTKGFGIYIDWMINN